MSTNKIGTFREWLREQELNESATATEKRLAKEGKIIYDGLNSNELETISNLVNKGEMRKDYWKKELKSDGHNRITAYANELNTYFNLMKRGVLDDSPINNLKNKGKEKRNKVENNKVSKVSKIDDTMKFNYHVDFYLIDENNEVPNYESWLRDDLKIDKKDISDILTKITDKNIEWETGDITFERDKQGSLYISISSSAYYNPDSTSKYAEIPGNVINLILKKFKFKNYMFSYKDGK